MPLPKSERFVYEKNTLAEVLIQLQFSPITAIDADPPTQLARLDYPLYNVGTWPARTPSGIPRGVAQDSIGSPQTVAAYISKSQDETWQFVISREMWELKTSKYCNWEDFSSRAHKIQAIIEKNYNPPVYTRLSLHFSNIIRRSEIGLTKVPWSELLIPQVGGQLCSNDLMDDIDGIQCSMHCKLEPANCFLTLNTGLVLIGEERCFLIDSDLHNHGQLEVADATKLFDDFHRQSDELFQWCILPRLREALQPIRAD